MPEALTLTADSKNVLGNNFTERIRLMIFLYAEADLKFSQLLEMLLQPLDHEVATVILQGNRQAIRASLLFLLLPLPHMFLDPLTARYRAVVIELLWDLTCEEWPRDVNMCDPPGADGLFVHP